MPESTDPEQSERRRIGDETSQQHRPGEYRSSRQARPSRPFRSNDPFERIWTNAGLRISGNDTVHAVRIICDNNGNRRPAPACHTGHDQYDSDALQPIYFESVSCGHCKKNGVAWNEGRPYDPDLNQQPLPGMPSARTFPPSDSAAG